MPQSNEVVRTNPAASTKTALLIVGAAIVVLLLAALAIWLLPAWLTQHPHLSDASDRHKAAADARTGVVAFLAVLGALGGLYYTSKTFKVGRDAQIAAGDYANQTSRLGQETLALTERGQITDRYSKAVDQLGAQSPVVCVGGIYALGQIMLDSPRDYERPVVGVLSAFVRREAKRRSDYAPPWPEDEAERDETKPSFRIQAALTVLKSRPLGTAPDLRDTDLRGARLRRAGLAGANFRRSYLYKAKLAGADLSGASLDGADLTGADLAAAILDGANLKDARLTKGSVTGEQLRNVRHSSTIEWVPRDLERPVTDDEGPEPI
jgi:hypothetical protein